ncbi:hydroxymethylbilane synthase [Ilumatobacter nonamiensis]|uniref:hydroxymethylbilane synthase n=1 Tax=Ilumatobacter nonamiensis TaxID=467093 RepID=UPI00034AA6CA|nr:hydroxymethylbilane synthase [Ilumatobacter nonamiensis]
MPPESSPLRLATRGSRQALGQANVVAEAVSAASGRPVQLVLIETSGDARQDVPLHSIGGQGVFVKEVQRAVLDGRADLAVHSAKDLMSEPAAGLTIGAYTERRSPNDVLVGSTLDGLEAGATVASGSVRRRAQLAAVRPDLCFVELRGNIDTRLSKIPDGGAIVMARAALEILDLTDRIDENLPIDRFVPAVGQGCVAVECRSDDTATLDALATVDDAPTRHRVEVERAFLAELGSGCSLPVAGHVDGDELRVFLAAPEEGRSVSEVVALSAAGSDHGADLAAARSAAHRLQERLG